MCRHRPHDLVAGAQRRHRPDHLRDHIAGAAHDDGVAYPHVLAGYLVLVVERGIGHGRSTDEHRLQNRKGRHGTRSTDVHLDAKQAGRLLLGRKLVRDRPTGAPCREPHLCLLGQWIYLHDHAVGLIRQVVTASLGVFDVCHHLVEVHHDLRAGVDRQAVAVEPGQRRAVRLEGGAPLDEAQLIYPYGKSPGGRDRRVFLADRPRGGIPGVDEEPLTGVCLRPVEVVECG